MVGLDEALAIAASEARLFCARVPEAGVVRLDGAQLDYGPNASPDRVATLACRVLLHDRGTLGEDAVASEVRSRGFCYVEQTQHIGGEVTDASSVSPVSSPVQAGADLSVDS